MNATGLAFNSLAAIEQGDDGRTNPMVNAGAIATTSLVPGATFGAQVANPLGRGGGGGISLDITGPDLTTLSGLADQIQATAAGVPGVTDVRNTGWPGAPTWRSCWMATGWPSWG